MWKSFPIVSIRHLVVAIVLAMMSLSTEGISQNAKSITIPSKATIWEVIPSQANLCVSSHSLVKSCDLFNTSALKQQFSNKAWTLIAKTQTDLAIGSLMNLGPWFGVHWDEICLLPAPGAFVGCAHSDGSFQTLFLFNLAEQPARQAFIDSWILNRGGDAIVAHKLIGESGEVLTFKNGRTDALVSVNNWIATAASPVPLIQWLNEIRSGHSEKFDALKQDLSNFPEFKLESEPGEVRWLLKPWRLLNSQLTRSSSDDASTSKSPKPLQKVDQDTVHDWKRFGADSLRLMGGQLHGPTENKNYWQLKYKLFFDRPLKGGMQVMNLVEGPSVDLPRVFYGQVDSWSTSYIDTKPWFEGVSYQMDQAIDPTTPDIFKDALDAILTDPEGPKIDVYNDLIYRAGPLLMEVESTELPKGKGSSSRSVAWAAQVDEPTKVKDVLKRFFEFDDVVKTEVLGDFTWWFTEDGQPLLFAAEKSETATITVLAIDNAYVYAATDSKWFIDLLKQAQQSNEQASPHNRKFSCWTEQLFNENMGMSSLLQGIELRSWLRNTWNFLPSSWNKSSKTNDWTAMLLTELLFGGTRASEVLAKAQLPEWNVVSHSLGIISHQFKIAGDGLDGSIWINSNEVKPPR